MKRLAALLICLFWAAGAQAGLTPAELADVAVSPPPGARLDLGLTAPDTAGATRTVGGILGGRPAFFTFVDYTCTTLCGTSLALLAAALEHSELAPSDYRIVVMGLDPKDPAQAAMTMAAREIPDRLRAAAVFLLPDRDTLARATAMLGFHYAYDAASDQFAHPSAVYAIASDGSVRSVLSPFALTTQDIASALAAPRGTGLYDRVRLLCYGLDPLHGVYTGRIADILRIAGALTVVLLVSAVALLAIRARRAR
ncbi:MAG TPA: SCO family protein [Stellaceae bacterium]|nr:SCO family protein [Stellaceae bacterium]